MNNFFRKADRPLDKNNYFSMGGDSNHRRDELEAIIEEYINGTLGGGGGDFATITGGPGGYGTSGQVLTSTGSGTAWGPALGLNVVDNFSSTSSSDAASANTVRQLNNAQIASFTFNATTRVLEAITNDATIIPVVDLSTLQIDEGHHYVVRANATASVSPTEVTDPEEGDTAEVHLNDGNVERWTYDGATWTLVITTTPTTVPVATETTQGILEITTDAELLTGTDDDKIVTPLKLRNAQALDADVTAATADKLLTADKVIDEDNFASDADTRVPTQQSTKAYVDAVPRYLGEAATFAALPAAANTNDVAVLTNDDSVNFAGLYRWNGAAYQLVLTSDRTTSYEATFTSGNWTSQQITIAAATHGLGIGRHDIVVYNAANDVVYPDVNCNPTTGDITLTIGTNAPTFAGSYKITQ